MTDFGIIFISYSEETKYIQLEINMHHFHRAMQYWHAPLSDFCVQN